MEVAGTVDLDNLTSDESKLMYLVERIVADKHSDDEDSSDDHDDECNVCGEPGDLICCEECPRVFHVDCLVKGGRATRGELEDEDMDFVCFKCGEIKKAEETAWKAREEMEEKEREEGGGEPNLDSIVFEVRLDEERRTEGWAEGCPVP